MQENVLACVIVLNVYLHEGNIPPSKETLNLNILLKACFFISDFLN